MGDARATGGTWREGWPRTLCVALALGLAYAAAGRLCAALPRDSGRLAPIWLPNAVALAALLRSPVRVWPAYVAAFMGANFAVSLSAGNSPDAALVLMAANLIEYLAAAVVLRRVLGREVRIGEARTLVVMTLAAGAAGLASALLVAGALGLMHGDPAGARFGGWMLAHPLSLVLVTPCLLVMSRWREEVAEQPLTRGAALSAALLVACDLLVFSQSRFPILFLAPPALLLVTFEAGALGAAVAVMVTAGFALWAWVQGMGPMALVRGDAARGAVLQLFLAACLFTSLPVASLLVRQRRSARDAVADAARARAAEEAARAAAALAEAVRAEAQAGEARYRLLADNATDMIARFSVSGACRFVSPACVQVLGYAPEELVGRTPLELVHRDDVDRVTAVFMALVAAGPGAPPPDLQYRAIRKDGAVIWLESRPRIVFDLRGLPCESTDVIRDITARKAMEAELAAARAAAEAGAQAKSDFLANMSHELRTPLTGILGYAEVLAADADLPEASRRHAARIGAAGEGLLSLVNDVLELSRIEAGGLALQPRPTDLIELLHGAMDLVRPQAQQKSLALSVEHGRAAPAVMVDADRLRQVMLNLLGNAVKFTARGVVTASLRCTPDAAGGAGGVAVRLAVSDTGVGIPADRLAGVFGRFEQADASTSRRYGGTGLGLSISRSLVTAMGGEIGVESTLGAGSVFTVSLRLPAAEAPRAEPVAAAEERPAGAALAGMRVLVAEDVAINRDLIALFLKPHGVALHMACDGAAAVEAAGAQPFDAILMDMQMPVLDGLEAARRIRAGAGPCAGAPIIALTANVLPSEVARCFAAGMDDHLGKPLTAAALVAKLQAATCGARAAAAAA